jgi:transposase
MLSDEVITGLPDLKVQAIQQGHPVRVRCRLDREARCPRCGGHKLRLRERRTRKIKGITHGNAPMLLEISVPKYRCQDCGRTFMQEIPGVRKYSRTSQPLKEELFKKHIQGINQRQLATDMVMGSASCERYVQEMFSLKYRERLNTPCPVYLGIDEHHFGRKLSFATTLCDLRRHKIYDLLPGKAEASLRHQLADLPDKNRVRIVVMDLSSAYRSIVQKHFPKALIVSDRFHVIQLVLRSFAGICQRIDPSIKWQRGLPKLLAKNADNLTPEQQKKRDAYFAKQPAIKSLYLFKEELKAFLMTKGKSRKRLMKEGLIETFQRLLALLETTGFDLFKTLGKTLKSWAPEILRMFVFPFSNGVTEGFHRKMKLIQRRAYGFRNFENYRLRVIVLCGHLQETGL